MISQIHMLYIYVYIFFFLLQNQGGFKIPSMIDFILIVLGFFDNHLYVLFFLGSSSTKLSAFFMDLALHVCKNNHQFSGTFVTCVFISQQEYLQMLNVLFYIFLKQNPIKLKQVLTVLLFKSWNTSFTCCLCNLTKVYKCCYEQLLDYDSYH